MPHLSEDELALAALGETENARDEHLLSCPDCAKEVSELSRIVNTARQADFGSLPPAPSSVWHRVVDELGLQTGPVAVPSVRPAHDDAAAPRGWLRRDRLAAAGLAAAAAAAVAFAAVGLAGDDAPLGGRPSTTLSALDDSSATGKAQFRGGQALVVSTSGLPTADDSHYQVWLLDPSTGNLVDLGPLEADGTADLALPTGMDPGQWPVIDISAEPDDGDPSHSGDSVLRGSVPT